MVANHFHSGHSVLHIMYTINIYRYKTQVVGVMTIGECLSLKNCSEMPKSGRFTLFERPWTQGLTQSLSVALQCILEHLVLKLYCTPWKSGRVKVLMPQAWG